MHASQKQGEVLRLLRVEFHRERESNFGLLREVPNTDLQKTLDYFCALERADADSLAEAFAQGALTTFFPYAVKHPAETGNQAFQRFMHASTEWRARWKYEGVRDLRAGLAFADANPEFDNIPGEVRKRIEAIKPVTSSDIRRVVKLAFGQTISPLAIGHVGGLWRYDGLMDGRTIRVNIDYHQKYLQFEYGIAHPFQTEEIGKINIDLSYEGLLGVGRGGWDCIEWANLDQSIALLRDLILRCHRFLPLLPNPHEHTKST
jgi:hypothetical protein